MDVNSKVSARARCEMEGRAKKDKKVGQRAGNRQTESGRADRLIAHHWE